MHPTKGIFIFLVRQSNEQSGTNEVRSAMCLLDFPPFQTLHHTEDIMHDVQSRSRRGILVSADEGQAKNSPQGKQLPRVQKFSYSLSFAIS